MTYKIIWKANDKKEEILPKERKDIAFKFKEDYLSERSSVDDEDMIFLTKDQKSL